MKWSYKYLKSLVTIRPLRLWLVRSAYYNSEPRSLSDFRHVCTTRQTSLPNLHFFGITQLLKTCLAYSLQRHDISSICFSCLLRSPKVLYIFFSTARSKVLYTMRYASLDSLPTFKYNRVKLSWRCTSTFPKV